MLDENELLFDGLYEKTKDCGRVQFINLLIAKERDNQELKKQLKEYEHHLKISKEMLDLQRQDGNYNYDNYMLGLYNGMEYIMSLFEVREPIFKDGKNIKFLNDKNQQKEFIEWLEDKLNMCDGFLDTIKSDLKEISYAGRVSGKTYIATQIMKNETAMKCYEEVLSKYKQMVGGNND